MQRGVIRRRSDHAVVGRWMADLEAIRVETDDPSLQGAADEVLGTVHTIPVHPPKHFEVAGPGDAVREAPSRIKYLALFAMEMEERGFTVEPEEE